MNEKWKDYTIVILLVALLCASYSLWEQSGDYHSLETELQSTREQLNRAKGNQRNAIEQLESVLRGIDRTSAEAESISIGIEDIKNRTAGDQGKTNRSRELIDDCLRILRDSRRESEEAQRQAE